MPGRSVSRLLFTASTETPARVALTRVSASAGSLMSTAKTLANLWARASRMAPGQAPQPMATARPTVAASHTVGEFLLPGWLSAVRTAEQPDMLASVEIVNSPGVLQAVRGRDVQIGFVEGLDPLEGYEVLTVREDSLVVVVAGDHRWSRRRAISSHDLTNEPDIAREAARGPEPWS